MRFSHTHIAKQLSELAGQQESNCNWVLPLSIADLATAVGMGEKAAQHPVTWQLFPRPPGTQSEFPREQDARGMGEWGEFSYITWLRLLSLPKSWVMTKAGLPWVSGWNQRLQIWKPDSLSWLLFSSSEEMCIILLAPLQAEVPSNWGDYVRKVAL